MSKSHIPRLGAINAETGLYVNPKLANKCDTHNCPECKKTLILRKGKFLRPHFAHKKCDNPCNMYNHPGISQIHKDAQYLLKDLLERKCKITISRECCNKNCLHKDGFEIPEISSTSQIVLEYQFEYNGMKKIADIAYLDNDELVCIFEIYNTHETHEEARPNPWFEIRAFTFINQVSETDNISELIICCVRSVMCDKCFEDERSIKEKEQLMIKNKIEKEEMWEKYLQYDRERRAFTYENRDKINESKYLHLSIVISEYKQKVYTEYNFGRNMFERVYYDKYLIAIEDLYNNDLHEAGRKERLWYDWDRKPFWEKPIDGCNQFTMYRFLKYYSLKSPYRIVKDIENNYLTNQGLKTLADITHPHYGWP